MQVKSAFVQLIIHYRHALVLYFSQVYVRKLKLSGYKGCSIKIFSYHCTLLCLGVISPESRDIRLLHLEIIVCNGMEGGRILPYAINTKGRELALSALVSVIHKFFSICY